MSHTTIDPPRIEPRIGSARRRVVTRVETLSSSCSHVGLSEAPTDAPLGAPPCILHVTAECWPFARTGGLGEAVAGLVTQQRLLGLEARIVMPLYDLARRGLTARGFSLETLCDDCEVSLGFGRPERVRVVRARIDPRLLRSREDVRWASLSCVTEFVECDTAFGREGIYGDSGVDFEDNAGRFAILARTAIERLRQLLLYNPAKDFVLHAHDWHAALAPLFLHTESVNDESLRDVARVVTVHNAAFQGHLLPDALQQLGVSSGLDPV